MKLLRLSFLFLLLVNFQTRAQSILYVGNSLTYSNDLPAMVVSIARKLGENVNTECICLPNYGLEDHWNDGIIQVKISSQAYDYVIFQQGPSSQNYGRSSLIQYGGLITELATKNKSQPAYFMVWPSKDYYSTFEAVIKNHSDAAKQNNALLIEGGVAWKRFGELSNTFSLYYKDQFHPSTAGSFLMALVHIKSLFPDQDLRNLKHRNFKKWIVKGESFKQLIEVASNL